jgi:hypothetical protein
MLSVGEGLRWLGRRRSDAALLQAAEAIERAVCAVLERGEPLTFDLAPPGKAAPCSVVGAAVTGEIERHLEAGRNAAATAGPAPTG